MSISLFWEIFLNVFVRKMESFYKNTISLLISPKSTLKKS